MEEVEAFRQHLELRGLAPVTIARHCYTLQRYSSWCTEQGYDLTKAREEDLLGYSFPAPVQEDAAYEPTTNIFQSVCLLCLVDQNKKDPDQPRPWH